MYDVLPFPRVIATTPEEQIKELLNYLIQFKETLEFALTNITTESLSPELINKLNELGANIEQNKVERENEIAQISNGSATTVTVFDVINSPAFTKAVNDEVSNVTFTVNFENGCLEYNFKEE